MPVPCLYVPHDRCWRRTLIAAACTLVLLGGVVWPARAQDTAPVTSVRGVVYDSLAMRPLAGARVWSADGRMTTMADAAGRYTLDGVAVIDGTVALLAHHPAADSVGLSTLAAAGPAGSGGVTSLAIAIPSFGTLRQAACRGLVDAGVEEGGILFGAVVSARTGRPIPGATADVSWLEFRGATGRGGSQAADLMVVGLEATADGDGIYYACGVPADEALSVRATAGPDSLTSGEVPVVIGERRIVRRDVMVGAASGGVLEVSVETSDATPLPGAWVSVDDGVPVLTDAEGRVTLSDIPTGSRSLAVRLIGYAPQQRVVEIAAADTARQLIELGTVQLLSEVRVVGARRLADVEARRATGIGYTISGQQLANAGILRNVLNAVPFMQVQGTMNVALAGRAIDGRVCAAAVYLNGRPSSWDEIAMYPPSELMALEVFRRGAGAPRQYIVQSLPNDCGVVLAWTKT